MKNHKYVIFTLIGLVSFQLYATRPVFAETLKQYAIESFQPVLLKAEISSDLFQPSDTVYVTCWFQNVGDRASEIPLQCFAELSFGHQRILENTRKYHRFYWDPYPATNQWRPGDVWKTTFKFRLNNTWGGTYSINIGLCDGHHLPVKITGLDGKLTEQVEVGRVDLGWSWGTPTMDRLRKPITSEFNQPVILAAGKNTQAGSTWTIGKHTKVTFNKLVPEITAINRIEMNGSTRGMAPSVSIREYATDALFYSGGNHLRITYSSSQAKDEQVQYKGIISLKGKEVAEFTLVFAMVQDEMQLSMRDVKEKDGYELLEITMPSLLSLSGKVDFVYFLAGGRILSLDRAIPEGYSFKYDTRNAAALLRSDDKLVLESTCVDDRLNVGWCIAIKNEIFSIIFIFLIIPFCSQKIVSII